MTRFASNTIAAAAAVLITMLAMQQALSVPPAQASTAASAPIIA